MPTSWSTIWTRRSPGPSAAGAVQEGETCDAPYGRLAMFADPFGHGFCLIEFNEAGYDAIAI